MTEESAARIERLTWDGHLITAPLGTRKCAQTIGRPHHRDLIHGLFASENPGPMVQLMTRCGGRAHRFVLESDDKDIDCPECLELEVSP